ncbi:MAG TPA: hypothetical protein VFI20_11805, partial [Terracidiphilus sp.]|nr:hypothetical protein [Terracidiphilus sp.]
MRFTIERLRTMVLAAGALLLVTLAVFLVVGRWRNSPNRRDMPKRLGLDIKQEANGWTYTHGVGGHTLFKIHASRLIQMKKGNHVLLHEVRIELYGADGASLDSIEGNEFEYDPEGGIARAAGPVEILLTRPGVAPAIAPGGAPGQGPGRNIRSTPLKQAAQKAARGEIRVETSGLIFDRNSGMARTDKKVEFTLAQGRGSAVGALYDSAAGKLVLGRAVQVSVLRGGQMVNLQAEHAEFENDNHYCVMRTATASYRGGDAWAAVATVRFAPDGSADRMEARNGFVLKTATGGQLTAPSGSLEFGARNQPTTGNLEGGVVFDADEHDRLVHGTAPSMEATFTDDGMLRHVHLEHGVEIKSRELRGSSGDRAGERTWHSPVADVEFRSAGQGRVELASITGVGGAVVTSASRRGKGRSAELRMIADTLMGTFGPDSALNMMTGTGHASIEQTTATGARQTTSGDQIVARFGAGSAGRGSGNHADSVDIQSATVEGHVVLAEQPEKQSGPRGGQPLRAAAEKAVYERAGEWLHLTGSPRIEDGPLQLSAAKIDLSQATGDAVAQGNVKGTLLESRNDGGGAEAGAGPLEFGGQGPAHVVADEAQLHQATGEAEFHGQARLWQQGNSISAPVIVLDRTRQTLVARTQNEAEPVRVVLVSAGAIAPAK